MSTALTLIVTYRELSAASEAAMAVWRQLNPETFFCRVGADQPAALPQTWPQMPPQPDAGSVGREAVGFGRGDWLMVVDAGDRPDPGEIRRLQESLPRLDPRTIYLVPVPVSNRLVDVQPRLLHRTGVSDGEPSPAAELGLQMALLPIWPLLGPASAEEAWIGIQDADPLIVKLARGEQPADETIPDPHDAHLPHSLRLLLADDDRLHQQYDSAMAWLRPVLESGPDAIAVMAGLIDRDRGRTYDALRQLHVGLRSPSLVQWPGYYPRAAVDRRMVAEAIADVYTELDMPWAATLYRKLAQSPDEMRQRRLLLTALAEQGEQGHWDDLLTVMAYAWQIEDRVEGWREALKQPAPAPQLAQADVWEYLEAAGLSGQRASKLLKRLTRDLPDDVRAWQRLGSRALVDERWSDAEAALTVAAAAPDAPGWVWNSLGVALVRQDRLIDAERSFRRAAEGPAPEPSAERNLAELRRMLAQQLRRTTP